MKSKAGVWFLIILVIVITAAAFYFFLRPTVSADVNARQNGIKPKIFSDQNLTLQEVSKDKYRITQPIASGSGFGIQIAYPSGLTPSDAVLWARDEGTGVIVLDKTYKKVAIYPIKNGEHQINCKIGNQDILITFSDKGFTDVSPTATATEKAKTSATTTATKSPKTSATAGSTSTISAPVVP